MSRNSNANARAAHMPLLMQYLDDAGLEWHWVAGDWHMRIEGIFDVFPTSQKWHFIPGDLRGRYHDYESLQDAFMTNYYENGLDK